jgi:hypothetical protein
MRLALLACSLGFLPPLLAGAAQPLDPSDHTAREIRVHFERSFNDPGAVAQTFDEGWPATWSVQGNVGRVEMSVPIHEKARESLQGLGLIAIPTTFSPFVVEVDLTTLAATSLATGGALSNGTQGFGFSTRVLDTQAAGGFIGPDTGPLFCTSQQEVDDACLIVPLFCGQTCTLVPGFAYDPLTGTLNLIGSEEQNGCDGAVCFGPFEMFATTGDLKLTESATPVPAASLPARGLLVLLLVAGAALFTPRRAPPPGQTADSAAARRSARMTGFVSAEDASAYSRRARPPGTTQVPGFGCKRWSQVPGNRGGVDEPCGFEPRPPRHD